MIHPYDSAIQMPNMDLYDTNMMQLYINAVQREYERGLQDQKEFLSKYGDFFSPFAKDVQNWDMNIMGPVMDMVDAFYKQGIDPARNPEARAMLYAQMRKVPYGEAAKMRYNAKMGEEYLKNRGTMVANGTYDPERELWELQNGGLTPFEQWDSSKGMWTRTSPAKASSLFDLTHEWFEKEQPYDLSQKEVEAFGLKYDPRQKYKGISRDKLANTLDQQIPGWLGTSNGAYYMYLAKKQLQNEGVENPSNKDVIDRLKRDILNANEQYVRRPVAEMDPLQKILLEDALQRRRDRENAARAERAARLRQQQTKQQNNQYSFNELVRQRAITGILGKNTYSPGDEKQAYNAQYSFGANVSNKYKGKSTTSGAFTDYVNKYATGNYYAGDIVKQIFPDVSSGTTQFVVSGRVPQFKNRFYSTKSVVSYTAGYRNKQYGTSRGILNRGYVVAKPTQRVYGALMKDGRFKNYAECIVESYDYKKDNNGKYELDNKGNYIIDPSSKKTETYWFDTHITSTGGNVTSLGVPVPGKAEVKPFKGVESAYVLDPAYVDRMAGDIQVTKDIIGGTEYDHSGTLTETPGYYDYGQ